MKIVMSIKPGFAELIFDGKKNFEFRRVLFKNPDVKTIIVYASSPIQKVIGEFEVESILSMKIDALWDQTRQNAGISKKYFMAYFQHKEIGYAIKVGKVKRYKQPKCLQKDFGIKPPQSFAYIK